MYSFEYPLVFLILIPFVICAIFCKEKKLYMYMPNFLNVSFKAKIDILKEALKWLGIIALVISLASPFSKESRSATKPAHGVVLMMDVSDSMSQGRMVASSLGGIATKLTVAKLMASEYIRERGNDNVGLIIFGDFAYVASPLSFDHESVAKILETVQRGVAGSRTAMYDALFLSTRLLKNSKVKEKVAILLTDGFNTAGKVPFNAAIRAIVSEKLKVYTIGVGRAGDYDERVLREISKKSGGEFFRANDAQSLKNVYAQIDKLQKSKLNDRVKYNKTYLYMYTLFFSFFCLSLYTLFEIKGVKK